MLQINTLSSFFQHFFFFSTVGRQGLLGKKGFLWWWTLLSYPCSSTRVWSVTGMDKYRVSVCILVQSGYMWVSDTLLPVAEAHALSWLTSSSASSMDAFLCCKIFEYLAGLESINVSSVQYPMVIWCQHSYPYTA